jgi:hypothetical protein
VSFFFFFFFFFSVFPSSLFSDITAFASPLRRRPRPRPRPRCFNEKCALAKSFFPGRNLLASSSIKEEEEEERRKETLNERGGKEKDFALDDIIVPQPNLSSSSCRSRAFINGEFRINNLMCGTRRREKFELVVKNRAQS